MPFVYYQPNPNETGDCVVRSICKATDHGWFFVFDHLVALAREMQDIPTEPACFGKYLERNGFKYRACTVRKGGRRQSVSAFCSRHKKGVYVLKCLCHVVCVVDGNYYDSWDSGSKLVYGYWKRTP